MAKTIISNVPLFKAAASVIYVMKYCTVQVILGLKQLLTNVKLLR